MKQELRRMDVEPCCQNCDFEYYCKEHKNGPCLSWRADLEYKTMLESCKG